MPRKPKTTSQGGGGHNSKAPYSQQRIEELLGAVAAGEVTPQVAMERLRHLPSEEIGFAVLDHHRCIRKNFPEVVFCAGKTEQQVAQIVERLAAAGDRVLGTRATEQQYAVARRRVRDLKYDKLSRVLWLDRTTGGKPGGIAVVAAGTADLPVAEEAARTIEVMGHAPQRIFDVGVAGLHRLMGHVPALRDARAVVVVAGMEGALPSVVAGLIAAPVIAVPTSVGYGASFGGLAALLGMLNSCAPGICVVNIDNGFGAGYLAATINQGCLEAHHHGSR